MCVVKGTLVEICYLRGGGGGGEGHDIEIVYTPLFCLVYQREQLATTLGRLN